MNRSRLQPLALALVFALGGPPAVAGTATEELHAGLQSLDRNDYAGAEIHLKNALQQRPDLAPAQVALGHTYLRQGRFELAESTLQGALRLGAERADIDPLRMYLKLRQGEFQAVLDGFDPYRHTGAARARMLRLRGEARLELGLMEEAALSFTAAREAAPQAPDGDIGLSMLALQQQDAALARSAAQRATGLDPRSTEAWTALAAAELAAGHATEALAAADTALKLDELCLPARAARVSALIALGRADEAQPVLDRLRRQNPADVRTLLLAAELARARQDPETARARLTDASLLLKAIPRETLLRSPSLLKLSGTVHEALGLSEKARGDLTQYLERMPGDETARRLLAAVLLRLGDPRQALELLQPLPDDPHAVSDVRLLTLLADAHTQLGQHATAAALLERLIELGGQQPALFAQLGQARLQSGQGDAALAALSAAWAQSGEARDGLLLASLQLGAGRPAEALRTLDAVAVRAPDHAVVLHLRGGARLARGDTAGARADFERALQLAPGLLMAAVNLARLDAVEGRPADGIRRLEQLISANPRDAGLRTDLGRLLLGIGRTDEAVRAWEQARTLDPRRLEPRLALAGYRLEHREPLLAQTVASEAVAIDPGSFDALAALGMSQLALQQTAAARQSFRQLGEAAGENLPRLLRAARHQLLAGAAQDAVDTLERARRIDPGQPDTLKALAEAQVSAGQVAAAEATARTLLAQPEPPADAWGLLGEILMARGQAGEAAGVYEAGHARHPRSAYAVAIWRAHAAAGAPARGLPALEAWAAQHPADPDARAALAIAWPQAGEWQKALGLYEALAAARPGDAMILNNLALLYLRTRDVRALATARRALAAAPGHPAVLDTLGWILVQQGQVAEGLQQLQAALARDPLNPELLWHLGYTLHRLGRPAEARRPLEQALATGTGFDGAREARQLLTALPR